MTVFVHPEPIPEMPDAMNDGIGGAWLAATYGLELVMSLKVVSRIGGRRVTKSVAGVTTETFVAAMRPVATWRSHLTFHLKHEVPHLEPLYRLFESIEGNRTHGLIRPPGGFLLRIPHGSATGHQGPSPFAFRGSFTNRLGATPSAHTAPSPGRAHTGPRWGGRRSTIPTCR